MSELFAGDDAPMLGGNAQHGKKATAKPLGMAMDDDEEDMFADMVVDDLDEEEGAAALPTAKMMRGDPAEENDDPDNKLEEAVVAHAKRVTAAAPAVHRPPRHPGKPTAVQQARAPELSVGAQDSCSMEVVQEQEEHESLAAEEQLVASPAAGVLVETTVAAAAPLLHDNSRSPSSSCKAPRSSETLAAADAVVTAAVAAAVAPTQPSDSEPQLHVRQLLAKVPSPKAAIPEPQVPSAQPKAPPPVQLAPAAAADPPAISASTLGAAARQGARAQLPAGPLPVAAGMAATASKPAAAPSLASGGSAASFDALINKPAAQTGGSTRGLSRLGQVPAGSKPLGAVGQPVVSKAMPAGMAWKQQQPQAPPTSRQPVPRQNTAAPALQQRLQAGRAQGTPGSVLPKHIQHAAAPQKAATPAPVTPAGDAAVGSTAVAQQEEQGQLQQTAVRQDGFLAFDFAGAVSAVLKDHEEGARASTQQAVPITDAVQEQLLVLDQLTMQAEALRRQISGLRVDLTIYRSSLAFLDDPRVASKFEGAERKVQELWAPLAAYVPPCIELPPPPPPPSPLPPAEEEQVQVQPMQLDAAEEEVMVHAVPDTSGSSANEPQEQLQAGPDRLPQVEVEGTAGELVIQQAPQPSMEAAGKELVAPTDKQPGLVAPSAEAATDDSEMVEGQDGDSNGGMEEEQACIIEEQSSREQASSEVRGSREEQASGEECGSEGARPSTEEEGSQPALQPTQSVECASPGVATEPPLEQQQPHSKEGSLAPRALSFDSEPASGEDEADGAAAPMQAAGVSVEPAVSVSLEDGGKGEVKLSLLSFYTAGQPTLQSTLE